MSSEIKTLLGSASALHRTFNCPASWHLPAVRARSDGLNEAAARGTAIHSYVEHRAKGMSPEEASEQIPQRWRNACRLLEDGDIESLAAMVPGSRHEVAMSYHGRTGDIRYLGESKGRDYDIKDAYETPGTSDVVLLGRYRIEVWDLKTGRSPVPPPAVNPQLLHGALCVMELLAPYAEEAVVGIQTLKGHGKIETECAVVTREEIVEHAGRHRQAQKIALRVIQAIDAGEDPEVHPGPWCQWCDAGPVCPQNRS